MTNKNESHEFALYFENLTKAVAHKKQGDIFTIDDETVSHRIKNVLRLAVGDQCLLFDRAYSALVQIQEISKKKLAVEFIGIRAALSLAPRITILLPVLKREALSEALYACVELGANEIQLITTQKTHKAWATQEKELQHAQKIMIAAAEQSKNFAFPLLMAPMELSECVKKLPTASKIFFDPEGSSLFDTMTDLHREKSEHLILCLGPEGDLTQQEKKMLVENEFKLCALTPTVLRAQQALVVGLGSLRAVLKK